MNGLNSKKYDKLKKIKHDWDEAAKKGQKRIQDRVQESYSFKTGSVQNAYYLDILKNNHPQKNSIWLDVCCGSATNSIFMATQYECLSIGFDISLIRLQIAQKNSKSLKNIEFVNADLFHLPFKENIFDGIVSTQALSDYDLEEQKTVLQNFNKHLKLKGTFILSDVNPINHTTYNLLGMNTYLQILQNMGFSKVKGTGWGGALFQIMWKVRNKVLRKILKNHPSLLNQVERIYNTFLVNLANLEGNSFKKPFFFHIIGNK